MKDFTKIAEAILLTKSVNDPVLFLAHALEEAYREGVKEGQSICHCDGCEYERMTANEEKENHD